MSCRGTSRLRQNVSPRGPNGLLQTFGRTTPTLFIMQKKERFGLLTLLDCTAHKDPNQQWMFIKPPSSTYLFRCAIWRKTCLFFCTVCHQLNRSIFFFFLRCETFLRESRCRQNGGKLVWKQKSFQTADGIPPSDLQQHSGKLKPPFSLTR